MTLAIVWNPSKTEKHVLEEAFADAAETGLDVQWFETTEDDPGQHAAEAAIAAGATVLLVAGGDGTIRAVAEHVADAAAEVELAIIPLGTGNLLARNLGIPIDDLPAAFRRAMDGEAKPVDVGWVEVESTTGRERHAFVVMVGFGLDAEMINQTDDDLKDKAGWLAYVESLGRALKASEVIAFTIALDDKAPREDEAHTLLIANCGTLQGGVTLVPDADPSDGVLDFLVLRAEGLAQWVDALKTMVWDNGLRRLIGKGEKVADSPAVDDGRAAKIVVTLTEPRAFEVDGEEAGEVRAFTASIQPSAIRVR